MAKSREFRSETAAAGTMSSEKAVVAEIRRLQPECIFEMGSTQKKPVRTIIVISGRVQGVFFRAHARDKARELGLRGWAANNPDGTLTIVAEGPHATLRDFIQWCYTGPEVANVSGVSVQWGAARGDLADFNIHNS